VPGQGIGYDVAVEPTESEHEFQPVRDTRPHIPPPLPVSLVAVADVRLPAPPGIRDRLDRFYVEILGFQRLPSDDQHHCYQAENHCLILQVHERPVTHDRLSPTMVLVQHLQEVRDRLIEREVPFEPMRGLTPGGDYLLLRDPAGNWVGIASSPVIA
jgi:hypothetical protein